MSTLDTDQYRDHPTIDQGRYVILSCLGVGGMGAVFHAYDQRLKVYRAIKVLKPELVSRPEVRQRFTREAVSMAQLTHPHIVQIFDYGQEALTLYIVMEYLPGNSIQAHLDHTGALNVNQALSACLQVAQGLKYIHHKDLVHRDIKPANLLISNEGLKIADFGLVWSDQDQFKTRSEAVIGTFAFMSPEQRMGAGNTDHLTDIYALSASLYMMLTLKNPLHLHLQVERTKATLDLDPHVRRIIDRGMQSDRARRYQSCDEMITDLKEAASRISDEVSSDAPAGASSQFIIADPVGRDQYNLNRLLTIWRQYTTIDHGGSDMEDDPSFMPTELPSADPFAPTELPEDGGVEESVNSGASGERADPLRGETVSPQTIGPNSRLNSGSREEVGSRVQSNIDAEDSPRAEPISEPQREVQRARRILFQLIGGLAGVAMLWMAAQWIIHISAERAARAENLALLYPLVNLEDTIEESELSVALKIERALRELRLDEAEDLIPQLSDPLHRSMLSLVSRTITRRVYRLSAPVRFSDLRVGFLASPKHEIAQLIIKSWESRGEWASLSADWDAHLSAQSSPLAQLVMLSALEHADPTLQQQLLQRARQAGESSPALDYWRLMLTRGQGMEDEETEAYQDLVAQLQKIHPGHPIFQLEQARVDLNRGKMSLVEERLKTLLERHPHCVPARVLLAMVALKTDNQQLRVQQLMMSSDDSHPSTLAHYTLMHPMDLIDYGWPGEADKFAGLCVDQASHVKVINAQLECAQINLMSRLWRGTLYADASPLSEYTAMLSSAELDTRSRAYFKGIELYIRAQLALHGRRLDEATRLMESLDELTSRSDLSTLHVLTSYVKRRAYLERATQESLTQAWRAKPSAVSDTSSCLTLYGESLWARRAGDPDGQKSRLLKIFRGECKRGPVGGSLTSEALFDLIELHLERGERREAQRLYAEIQGGPQRVGYKTHPRFGRISVQLNQAAESQRSD